ncbi:MAG: glutathione S-transferase family protein [Prochlorococcaceae cyanobacterium]|jgi:glutathione S-transferase
MELHQFRYSAFCEKVRLILAAKGLEYTVVEVTPGLGQLELFRLSGQRQVPVLVDGGAVIADSTAIALHLEEKHPTPALQPADPADCARMWLLEDWADTALAAGARLALLQGAAADPVLRTALLPESLPGALRNLVGALPADALSPITGAVGEAIAGRAMEQLRRNLEQLALLVGRQPHLVGDQLSVADLAVAAQLSLLRFPAVVGAPLAGRGVAGIADNPLLDPLFSWRDRILASVGRA